MLDWITFKVHHSHTAIPAGRIIKLDRDGEEEWQSPAMSSATGSYDSKVMVRSLDHYDVTHDCGFMTVVEHRAATLQVSGNPSKFLQGHNVWGSDQALDLVTAMMRSICSSLGIEPVSSGVLATATVSRLDFTKSLEFETREQVRAYLSQVSTRAHSRNGRPATTGSTLYFQKSSRRHTVVCYGKGDELRVRKHTLPEDLPRAKEILEEADKLCRVELRLKGMELEDIKMRKLGDCTPERLNEAYADYIGRIQMTTATKIANESLKTLGRAVGNTYLLHKEGVDVRSLMTESTFYRHRAKLLPYGVDISVPMPVVGTAEIIPLHRVIEGQPYSPPSWAYTEGLIFQKTGS